MMRKIVFVSIFFNFFAISIAAQKNFILTGKVVLANQKLGEGAVVSLFKLNTNTLIKSNIADSLGSFSFTTNYTDSVYLVATYTGYLSFKSTSFKITENPGSFSYPTIQLKTKEQGELDEITVISKAPFVERKIDRTVINPDALIGNAGTNALEVLEKSPGVQVDINGNISLKGKQGVMVFVDDKPTYLAAADLANYLRSLPSSALATIELMTNPPAKYDAAGNAGIINIKLKRNIIKGISGGFNASYGQGAYARTNNSFNLNYRINKVNFFTNLSYIINNSYQDLFIERNYFKINGALNSAFYQNSFIKRHGDGLNGKIGFDYYINKKETFGIVLNGFINNTLNKTTNAAQVFDSANQIQGLVKAYSPSDRNFKNNSININYTYKLNEKGREISTNADYVGYKAVTDQSLLNNIYQGNGSFVSKTNLISDLPAKIDIWAFKADYLNPLKKGGRVEAGIKSSYVRTSNIANFYDETNGSITVNNDFSNNFNYSENINAAYLNYNFNKKKFSFQTGLRFENTNIDGRQIGNAIRKDSSFTRNYSNLFPTLFILYRLDSTGRHQLGLSVGRRINRPDYQSMNPFTYPLDRFTLYSGNPYLQPTFSQNIELSHTYKGRFTTAFEFTYVKDVISETIQQENGIFYSRPGNFGKQLAFSFSFNGVFTPAKWWVLQLYTEITRNDFTSEIYGQQLKNTGTYWYLGPTNQFTINKKWTAELAATYTTSVRTGQFITIPVWTMRMGLAKKILKDKGSFKFSLNDMFYSNQPGGDIIAIANSSAKWKSFLDTRVATITLSYRFNKGKSLNARNTGGSDAEKGRVK
ncbi:MAG: outer membrane beta-barrel family protein [Sediminibacterium sp.]|nr:outer membrane beta-barrel family protein [Sediminibacterium sp.]